MNLNLTDDSRFEHILVVLRAPFEGYEETGKFVACTCTPHLKTQDISLKICTMETTILPEPTMSISALECDGLQYLTSIENYPKKDVCLHIFMTHLFLSAWGYQ